jgi:hypothetical protein
METVYAVGSCFQWSTCKKFEELSDHGGKLQGWILKVWFGVWPGILLAPSFCDFFLLQASVMLMHITLKYLEIADIG